MVGKSLGRYEILGPLGKGGMGEVYRARDPNLKRDVAIKVLSEDLAADEERLARLEREAHLLASLNHPNIAAIHDLEESEGVRFLVLELVDGETLEEKLHAGRLGVEAALELARQIATALEAAHAKGIVHRDLKPSNVKVTAGGNVKVLDFGLAKAFEGEGDSEADLSRSPTITVEGTRTGVIMGTAAYMSPEQTKGERLDKRTDNFSFGCVLYEMLTGERPFVGEDVSETMAAILKEEPDWTALPAATPPLVQSLVRRCLRKNPHDRLHDIADARIEIEEALSEPVGAALGAQVGATERPVWRTLAPWIFAVVMAGAALWSLLRVPALETPPATRLVLTLPAEQQLAMSRVPYPPLAISPDGRNLVYGAEIEGRTQLFLRSLDEFEARPIPGTEGARTPFFSPDGQWVGFVSEGALKKVSLAGGAPLRICDATSRSVGASWGADDTIIFSPDVAMGLWRVSAAGGAPQELTLPKQEDGEVGHIWPQFLPGGRHVLFTVQAATEFNVAVLSLDTGTWRTLIRDGNQARYLPTGHLVYYTPSSGLVAVPFNLTDLEIDGSPNSVAGDVGRSGGLAHGIFAVSPAGTLVYVPGGEKLVRSTLLWRDRTGEVTLLMEDSALYSHPRISPDGKMVALGILSEEGADIWTYDLERRVSSRLTVEGNINNFPEWTPDGSRLAFNTVRTNPGIYWKRSDRSGEAEQLLARTRPQLPGSWSPDGKLLAFTVLNPRTREDISVISVGGDGIAAPVLETTFRERAPRFSPDGGWLAYVSDESGRDEVYVRQYPGPGGSVKISTDGGLDPVWRRDGGELYYRSGNELFVVAVETEPEFKASRAELLFGGEDSGERYNFDSTFDDPNFDVTADGQRFLMIRVDRSAGRALDELHVILNWLEELTRLVPTSR